ncbi:type III secretion system protein PrgN [Enterococcus faecium]|nr:type III secretion system protein PrgN [Enterococcus faecium]
MRIKNYVYSHAINAFIIGHLGMSVEVFCELYNFKQGTLSSWVTREREVADLPVSFLYALSLAAGEPMDQVYDRLCVYEEEYKNYRKLASKKKKKYLDVE